MFLLRQLVCNLAFAIENGAKVQAGSTDAVRLAPIPKAAVRCRRLGWNLIEQVGAEAVRGGVSSSGGQ